MAVTVTGPTQCVIGGRRYYTWSVEETMADSSTEFSIDVPVFCTLTQYEAVLDAGTGNTLDPAIALEMGDQAGTINQVVVNGTPGARICNRGQVAVTALGGVLYCRSNPDMGTDNTILTRITLFEGHC